MVEVVLTFLRKAGFGILFFLLACGAGGTGGDGGVGGVGGSPLGGGGNFADGTVPLPVQSTVAWDPVVDFYALFISCKNVDGPTVQCKGDKNSAPSGATLRLTAHQQIEGPPLGPEVTVVVNPDGSWVQSVTANAGQIVQICLLKSGLCDESLWLTIPPFPGEVNGTQGVMQNLVIDSNGNIYYSKNDFFRSKPRKDWSWTSLFISEAHAEEPEAGTAFWTGLISSELISRMGMVMEFTTPTVRWAAAECPSQPAPLMLARVEDEQVADLAGNSAAVWQHLPGGKRLVVRIPDATRHEIVDLARIELPNPGAFGGGKTPYLAAAVRNFVYLVNMSGAPFIEYRFNFPEQFRITQVFETEKELYVVLGAKDGGSRPDYSLYRIYRPYNSIESVYQEDLKAECTPRAVALSELTHISHLESHDRYFAALGTTSDGRYRLVVGSAFMSSDLHDSPIFTLQEFSGPVELEVLKMDRSGLALLLLDPIQKSFKILSFHWLTSPPDVSIQEIPMADLGLRDLSYPRLLTVDRIKMELAFLDITERNSRIYRIKYSPEPTYSLLPRYMVFDIGLEAPSILKFLEDGVGYNDNQGLIQRAQTIMERYHWDESHFDLTSDVVRDSLRPAALPGALGDSPPVLDLDSE